MEYVNIKASKKANSYFMELALRLSKKKGKRVYMRDIIEETHRRLKAGQWSLDDIEK